MPPENDEINVDELLGGIEAPSDERPMSAPEPPAAAPETPAAAPTWDGKAWEFEWNGKKVAPETQDKAKTWMSLGYNYSQRMGEFNKTEAQRQADYAEKQKAVQEMEQRFSPYSKVDEYARQNPQWWQHVLGEFQKQQQSGQGVDPRLAELIKPLEEKVSRFDQYVETLEQQKIAETQTKEDQALDQEIASIRKDFPNIDLSAPDPETGKSLEHRIIGHAKEMFGHMAEYRPGAFKAAFRDYLHDQLIEQAKASGREAIAKDAQVNAKKGILGKTPAPVKGITAPQSVRGKSYNDLTQEALRELGIS